MAECHFPLSQQNSCQNVLLSQTERPRHAGDVCLELLRRGRGGGGVIGSGITGERVGGGRVAAAEARAAAVEAR